MKMKTDRNWLQNKTEREDGCFVSVGGLVDSLEREQDEMCVAPMKPAFLRFVQLARRDRRLSLEQFRRGGRCRSQRTRKN